MDHICATSTQNERLWGDLSQAIPLRERSFQVSLVIGLCKNYPYVSKAGSLEDLMWSVNQNEGTATIFRDIFKYIFSKYTLNSISDWLLLGIIKDEALNSLRPFRYILFILLLGCFDPVPFGVKAIKLMSWRNCWDSDCQECLERRFRWFFRSRCSN